MLPNGFASLSFPSYDIFASMITQINIIYLNQPIDTYQNTGKRKQEQRRRKLYKNPELFQGFLNVEAFNSFLFKFAEFPKPSIARHYNEELFYNRLRWYDWKKIKC